MALVAFLAYGVAQDAKPPKQAKDQAEADLINSIPKATAPADQLKLLDQWTKAYPQTDYASERLQQYLIVYQGLNRPRDAFNTATEIVKTDPNYFDALRAILAGAYIPSPTPAELEGAEKVAGRMLNDSATVFADANKPAGYTAAQWTTVQSAMKPFAQRTIGSIYVIRKDNPRAEAELTKALQLDPTQGAVSQMLASAILAQNKTNPEKQPLAIYHFARAASYAGPGSLDAAQRKALETFVTKAYATYHGSNEGLPQLLELAKTNAVPPPDFAIKDIGTIEKEKAEQQAKIDALNPMLAFWRTIKTPLTGDGADAFWAGLHGAEIPGTNVPGGKFKGKLISMTPALRPKELVIAVEKPDVGDVTLKLEMPLPGKMDAGSDLEFEGEVDAYTKAPFMLTLKVDDNKEKIVGWTGKNPPPARKKAAKQ